MYNENSTKLKGESLQKTKNVEESNYEEEPNTNLIDGTGAHYADGRVGRLRQRQESCFR